MKKLVFATLITAALAFSACGGSKTEEKKAEEQTIETVKDAVEGAVQEGAEAVQDAAENAEGTVKEAVEGAVQEGTETVAAASKEVLAKYETIVNTILPLAEKVKNKDPKAILDYTAKTAEIKKFVDDNAEALKALTADDANKYKELTEKLASAFKK